MSDTLIEKVNQAINIVELASEYVQLTKKGKNFMGLCPFHDEKTPSFSVSPEKNLAYCMSCKKGGAPITFYQEIKNISFRDALYELAHRAGLDDQIAKPIENKFETSYQMMEEVARFYHFNLLNSTSGKDVLEYLNLRNIDFDSIEHFQIGLSPKYGNSVYQMLKDKGYETSQMISLGLVKQKDDGTYYDLFSSRLMFPITNEMGRVVAFSGRTLDKEDHVKYVNSPETPLFNKGQTIYHFSQTKKTIRKNMPLIVSEGFFDAIKIYQSGFNNVVATMGTALTKKHLSMLLGLTKNILLAFDGDKAGLNASFSAALSFLQQNVLTNVIVFPSKKDPDEFIDEYGDDAFLELVESKTINAYDFIYGHIKSKYNLDSLIDKPKFRSEILKLIDIFDTTVRDHYYTKLANELNITADLLKKDNLQPSLKPKDQKVIKTLRNKYENAEIDLIVSMIRSRELAYFIEDRLEDFDYVNLMIPSVRKKIMAYYEKHETFDYGADDLYFNDEERFFFDHHVYGHFHYQNNILVSKNELGLLIQTVKDAHLIRELEQIMLDAVKVAENQQEYIKMMDARMAIIKKIKG